MVNRCAFLVRDTLADDDLLAIEPLASLGWHVEAVPWRTSGVDWRAYHLVVIRSAWDYHYAPDEFLDVLARIDAATPLWNPLNLVRWNARKTYLRELSAGGIPIVPTVWGDNLLAGTLDDVFAEVGSRDMVIKPVVSASAHGTFRLHHPTAPPQALGVEAFFGDAPFMAQPLVPAVLTEGEYSLFYFDGVFSHAVLKTSRAGDYRVQEEHGGTTTPVTADRELLEVGRAALSTLDTIPLYARVDLVRATDRSGYWLMELELIEPVLYLGMDADAPRRFAAAIADRPQR